MVLHGVLKSFNPTVGLFGLTLVEWGILEAIDRWNFEDPQQAREHYKVGLAADIAL